MECGISQDEYQVRFRGPFQSIPQLNPPFPPVPCHAEREGMIRDLYCAVILIHRYFDIIDAGSWLVGIGPVPGGEEGEGEGEEGGYVDIEMDASLSYHGRQEA